MPAALRVHLDGGQDSSAGVFGLVLINISIQSFIFDAGCLLPGARSRNFLYPLLQDYLVSILELRLNKEFLQSKGW